MAASHKVPSERDLELLSAYLDNDLSDRERAALEQRLEHEDTLRVTLADLRETVALLRDLPRLKAPRNFTLDPAVYGKKTPWWKPLFALESILQLSGALGTAAAIVLIVLGLLSGGEGNSARDSAPAAEKEAPSEVAQQITSTPTGLPNPTPIPQEALPTMEASEAAAMVEAPAAPAPNAALYAADEAASDGVGAAESASPTTTLAPAAATLPQTAGASGAVPPADTDMAATGESEAVAQASEPSQTAMREGLESEGQTAASGTDQLEEPPMEAETDDMAEEQAPGGPPAAALQTNNTERREVSSKDSDTSTGAGWLAGLGAALLVVSLAAFFFGRRRARTL
jgi:anti-sigma factor RsiW